MTQLSLGAVTIIFACCVLFCNCCQAFVLDTKTRSQHRRIRNYGSASSSTIRHVIPPEILDDVESARGQFFLWFFGSSGGGGIALTSFPRLYEQVSYIQSLKGVGPSLGGDTLGLSPLCGYPQDIAIKDLEKVVNNKMTVQDIVKKFPQTDNYLASKGYVTYAAFEQGNNGCNPLAIRAVFDTFSQSTNLSDPRIAQEKINLYKEDVFAINGALFKSKVTSFSALFTLLFLLGTAAVIVCGHARDGWFHDWKLSDGILSIPDFWI
uniref:Uncharacterized protein n=1 Tax=Pseudo-nitzschia australis TaxID=44445 RepID=A0A7S4ENU5_9STRA|mmetsp:Transcript_5604/g.12225  ORF Transcript_5604/g.12225 Transcript_5604/m.12225 type:complete len:265 (-) Transcript_5604:1704-2498(-)